MQVDLLWAGSTLPGAFVFLTFFSGTKWKLNVQVLLKKEEEREEGQEIGREEEEEEEDEPGNMQERIAVKFTNM